MGLRNAWKGLFTSNNDLNSRRNRLKRMYAGARVDRTNLSWVTPLSSPDQSYKNSINTLRKRVHDLVRNNNYAAQAISCLLYTSPSPRDLSTSRMPSSA